MLNYNEIKTRAYIIHDNAPWEVMDYQVSRKQANKPVNKTKLKNLITGQTIDHTFHVSDKVNEADVIKRTVTYQFMKPERGNRPAEYWFTSPDDPSDRFELPETLVAESLQFVKEGTDITALVFTNADGDEQIIGTTPDMKVDLTVTEAPPNIKGDTATGGTKTVTVETGAAVDTPMFINMGDVIRINTETGDYVERVEKN